MVVRAEKESLQRENGRNAMLAVLTKSRCSFKKNPMQQLCKGFC